MTRPDVKQKCLGEFLDWSLTAISQTNDESMRDIMVLDGALQSLVNILSPLKPVVMSCSTCLSVSEASVICVHCCIQ